MSDEPLMAGSLTLLVAFGVTVWAIATAGPIEVVGLAAVLWAFGTLLRLTEVTA